MCVCMIHIPLISLEKVFYLVDDEVIVVGRSTGWVTEFDSRYQQIILLPHTHVACTPKKLQITKYSSVRMQC